MEIQEINARLEAARATVDELAAEIDTLTTEAPPALGCRVSYVRDRLDLVREEINACLEFGDHNPAR